MKHIALPALSLFLLTAMSAQAQLSGYPYLQIAQSNPDRPHYGDVQSSSTVVSAGSVDNASAGHDRSTGAGHAGGTHSTDGTGHTGTGGTGSPVATGSPTIIGRQGAGMAGDHDRGRAATEGDRTGTTLFGTRPPNWNQYPRSFDRRTYERNFNAPRHYHWRNYNRPSGWYYRRWVFGQIFPRIFWARDYWLTDYWMFDLPVPPYGYVWVRYGDDALLVNRRTGRVLQVVYGLFD